MQRRWLFMALTMLFLAILAVPYATSADSYQDKHAQQEPTPTTPATVTPIPVPTLPTPTGEEIRCFQETGHCIQGSILVYWENNGGLPVFGYPITPVSVETVDGWTGPVQWFQRDRLEDHGLDGILAGRLGAALLELQGRPWFTFAPASTAPQDCRYFLETNHSLCEPFLSYWERNGGLERFGFPITEPFIEEIDDWEGAVQYFERRRMEHHILLPGSPVLLGLLGEEVLNFDESALGACPEDAEVIPQFATIYEEQVHEELREKLGCPTSRTALNVRSAIQNFEFGVMIWTDRSLASGREIYAVIYPQLSYSRYEDTWREGDPVTPDVTPPPGLHRPRGGFGTVWINNADLRSQIGWAVEELERFDTADIQKFEHGTIMRLNDVRQVFVFGPDAEDVQIIPQ